MNETNGEMFVKFKELFKSTLKSREYESYLNSVEDTIKQFIANNTNVEHDIEFLRTFVENTIDDMGVNLRRILIEIAKKTEYPVDDITHAGFIETAFDTCRATHGKYIDLWFRLNS